MKSAGRSRSWLSWARSGSVTMAVLAVLSLGVTVFVARRAFSSASEIIVRGEADALVTTLASELGDRTGAPTPALLEEELATHRASGLRYLAVVDRGRTVAEAGDAQLPAPSRPGPAVIAGRRIRVVGFLRPRRGDHPPEARHARRRAGPLLFVVELEPPIIQKLRDDLTRVAVVAAGAGIVLLAFAIAWSRSAKRLAGLEQRAAREQRLVALGSMSSVMAHELRNPLASLKGHAQLLAEDLDDPGDAKRRAKAERVVREAERLELLTTSLLDFVRDGPIERERIAPSTLASRALRDLPNERVRVDVERAPPALVVDAARLGRALHNLVDNALQASGEEPVELTIEAVDGGAVVRVRDHGPGLTPGSESQIFEPFVTTRVRGTGLGLAVARRIAEQHGGSLTGENHPAGGAVFSLRLPPDAAATNA